MLLLRLAGSLLLRFDTRTFSGLLFQEPPRISAVFRCYQRKLTEELLAEPPGVAKRSVPQPGGNAALDVLESNAAEVIEVLQSAQAPSHANHVGSRQPGLVRQKPPAEKGHPFGACVHPRFALVEE